MFVLRDVLQFSQNLNDVATTIQSTHRTMKIHLGFASGSEKKFLGVDYAYNFANTYGDSDYLLYSESHPRLDGIFFQDKHVQPSGDMCVGNILKANHGKITPATLYRDIAGLHKTGDMQVAVMDPEGQ